MKAQTSLGSQPQYRPQAYCAQIGPAMSAANVQIGNANACTRYATWSMAADDAMRHRKPDRSASAVFASARDLTRKRADAAAPTRKAEPAMIAPSTWMTSQ